MRSLIPTVLTLLFSFPVMADEIQFSKVVKASLVFRDDFDASRSYPHILRVYLRLDNVHDADVTWVANPTTGIEAELLDFTGRAVPQPPQAASIPSNNTAYRLPYGSRLDWLITHGGISMVDAHNKYALMVGGRGWLIPRDSLSSYSLRIRLRGVPWTTMEHHPGAKLLLDIPSTKLEIAR